MRTVKILLALAVIAMCTTGAMAQDTKKKRQGARLNPVSRAMVQIEKLHAALKKMDLTEDQQAKIKELHTAAEPQMKTAMKQIMEIVGEEKMKQVQEISKKGKEAGKTPWQVAVAVEAALKLDDEQQEKLAKIGKELTTVQRGISKKVTGILTAEQKEKLKAEMAPRNRGGKGKKKQDK